MFYQIFLSPQVKRWAIITYKHGIYELPHELPKDLGNIRKVSNIQRMIAQCPVPLPRCTSRNLLENRNETFPVMRYFTWTLELVSDIL